MKKLIAGLIILSSISVFAKDFNPNGVLHCATDMGGYDNVSKFEISPMKNNGLRDLTIYTWGGEMFTDSCSQQESKINCLWEGKVKKYQVTVDLTSADPHYDLSDDLDYYFLDGAIKKTFSSSHGIICRQYIK